MKTLLTFVVVLALLGAGGYAAYPYARDYIRKHNLPTYREAAVVRGDIASATSFTGTIRPVQRVQVGAFVSGPIEKLYVDFNDDVEKDHVLAEIDPRIYKANVARDEAQLSMRKGDCKRVSALLEQARKDEQRARELLARNPDYLSEAEMDQLEFNRKSLEAQLEVADATVLQAEQSLELARINLEYTKIRSPVAGKIIDRKIDEGQTLVAQFQTPEMFVVAPDLRKEMHVYASVNEADIGELREAQRLEHPVLFTVDAYLDELFQGKIVQIRMNPTEVQNVVTYTVVVAFANPDLKLLPGMTANLSVELDKREKALKVPNAALRFYPDKERVHPDDRKILEGEEEKRIEAEEQNPESSPARERIIANQNRSRRHVWYQDGEFLRAIEIVVGVSDHRFTEVVSGALEEGKMLVTREVQ